MRSFSISSRLYFIHKYLIILIEGLVKPNAPQLQLAFINNYLLELIVINRISKMFLLVLIISDCNGFNPNRTLRMQLYKIQGNLPGIKHRITSAAVSNLKLSSYHGANKYFVFIHLDILIVTDFKM